MIVSLVIARFRPSSISAGLADFSWLSLIMTFSLISVHDTICDVVVAVVDGDDDDDDDGDAMKLIVMVVVVALVVDVEHVSVVDIGRRVH